MLSFVPKPSWVIAVAVSIAMAACVQPARERDEMVDAGHGVQAYPRPEAGSDAAVCSETVSDPHNCGWCGHDCAGATCRDGICEAVSLYTPTVGDNALSLAIDGALLFWTNARGDVMQMSVLGANPHAIAADGDRAVGVVARAPNVFWANRYLGQIRTVALPDGTPATLASDQLGASGVALDPLDAVLYWTARDSGTIARMAIADNVVIVLAAGQPEAHEVVVDATHAYWTVTGTSGAVRRVLKSGGAIDTLASNQEQALGITRSGDYVYWATAVGLMRVDLVHATEPEVFAATAQARFVVADGASIFWTAGDSVWTQEAMESSPRVLARGQPTPTPVGIDHEWVYWGNVEGGQVMKVHR